MAIHNSTETLAAPAFLASQQNTSLPVQREKISCWAGRLLLIDPFQLMDKRVRVGESTHGADLDFEGFIPETLIYEATVVAVQFGSRCHGIETSLLLKHDHGDALAYVDVSSLTVLAVLQ